VSNTDGKLGGTRALNKAFVWFRQRFPHTRIVFCSDLDTQDFHALEERINVRYPKGSPFIEHYRMSSDFRQLSDSYQMHHHSK
jgi:hypothetical protein